MASLCLQCQFCTGRSVPEQRFFVPKSSVPYGKKCASAGILVPKCLLQAVWRSTVSQHVYVRPEISKI